MKYLIITTTLIFLILSLFHVYWLFGGKKFLDATIPKKENTEKLFQPSLIATLIVAIGLLAFAFITISSLGLTHIPFNKQATYVISIIFLARTIGDFKYIGFFKKIKTSDFAKNDNRVYIPICIYLSLATYLIAAS